MKRHQRTNKEAVYRANSCDDKTRYASPQRAWWAAREMARIQRERIRHYRCPFCHGWHIGHEQDNRL